MRNMYPGKALGLARVDIKSVDMRKSNPCKAVTTCRYFGGYALMRASFAPRETTKEAQYASTPAFDCDLLLNQAEERIVFALGDTLGSFLLLVSKLDWQAICSV